MLTSTPRDKGEQNRGSFTQWREVTLTRTSTPSKKVKQGNAAKSRRTSQAQRDGRSRRRTSKSEVTRRRKKADAESAESKQASNCARSSSEYWRELSTHQEGGGENRERATREQREEKNETCHKRRSKNAVHARRHRKSNVKRGQSADGDAGHTQLHAHTQKKEGLTERETPENKKAGSKKKKGAKHEIDAACGSSRTGNKRRTQGEQKENKGEEGTA